MFHLETIALYVRCISSLSPFCSRNLTWGKKKKEIKSSSLQTSSVHAAYSPNQNHNPLFGQRNELHKYQLRQHRQIIAPSRMTEDGSGFKYLCLYATVFLRIKQEEYKQEFFRQMAFSNLSTSHQQLVNKKWSREQVLTGRVFQTWLQKAMLCNQGARWQF